MNPNAILGKYLIKQIVINFSGRFADGYGNCTDV